jgi:hypothetical protein
MRGGVMGLEIVTAPAWRGDWRMWTERLEADMDPWSTGVLVVMALIAVWTCLSVLIERDERKTEAERDEADPMAVRADRTSVPVAGAVSPRGAQVSAVRPRDTGLVMRDQMKSRDRMKLVKQR